MTITTTPQPHGPPDQIQRWGRGHRDPGLLEGGHGAGCCHSPQPARLNASGSSPKAALKGAGWVSGMSWERPNRSAASAVDCKGAVAALARKLARLRSWSPLGPALDRHCASGTSNPQLQVAPGLTPAYASKAGRASPRRILTGTARPAAPQRQAAPNIPPPASASIIVPSIGLAVFGQR